MSQRPGLLSTVTLGLDPRVQGKESLFCRGVKGRKSGIHAAWMLAFASMTSPPHVMPDPDRASFPPLTSCPTPIGHPGNAMPYFGGALRVGKAELVFLDARIRKHDGRRGWQG